jgi:hypothetical protein
MMLRIDDVIDRIASVEGNALKSAFTAENRGFRTAAMSSALAIISVSFGALLGGQLLNVPFPTAFGRHCGL